MNMTYEVFEKAVFDAYAAGYDAGFKARSRIDFKIGRRRSKEYKLAIEVVADAIRRARESEQKPNN
jgi:hypothetical protein